MSFRGARTIARKITGGNALDTALLTARTNKFLGHLVILRGIVQNRIERSIASKLAACTRKSIRQFLEDFRASKFRIRYDIRPNLRVVKDDESTKE